MTELNESGALNALHEAGISATVKRKTLLDEGTTLALSLEIGGNEIVTCVSSDTVGDPYALMVEHVESRLVR